MSGVVARSGVVAKSWMRLLPLSGGGREGVTLGHITPGVSIATSDKHANGPTTTGRLLPLSGGGREGVTHRPDCADPALGASQ